MFKSVCDCCGKQGDLNVYILRIERISNPSIAIRYDTRDAEVILPENREEQTIKYLLCSKCYTKTGLPFFPFGKDRRFEFRKPMMDFTKCRFCHKKGDEYICELRCFASGNCCYAMQNVAEPKFGEEPSYCDEYEEKEE